MSTEFGLYHESSKTFIWLGKVIKGEKYQTPDRVIVAFMANQQEGLFSVVADSDDLPEDKEDSWQEIGDWPWPDDTEVQ